MIKGLSTERRRGSADGIFTGSMSACPRLPMSMAPGGATSEQPPTWRRSAAAHTEGRHRAEAGDLTGARTLLEDALAAGELRLGRDDPSLAPLMIDLATIARHVGNLTEAQNQLRRAYAVVVASAGPDDPTALSIEGRLAAVSYRLGEPTDAYDWHIADVGTRVLGADHPAVRGAQQRLDEGPDLARRGRGGGAWHVCPAAAGGHQLTITKTKAQRRRPGQAPGLRPVVRRVASAWRVPPTDRRGCPGRRRGRRLPGGRGLAAAVAVLQPPPGRPPWRHHAGRVCRPRRDRRGGDYRR